MAKLMINKNKKEGTIAPEIYGHFSEHLGRCIYEGLYVGENSEIPNVIFLCFAGRAAALQTNIIGRMVLDQRKIERK